MATWDQIFLALQSLFPNIDFGETPTHRLEYENFERILINLLMLIDLKACKRKYRAVKPATEKAAIDRFLSDACEIINGRGVFAQQVSIKQLKMLGGEPFRRFLGGLIEFTLKQELENSSKSLSILVPDDELILTKLIKERQKILDAKLNELESLDSIISKLEADSRYERMALEEKWSKLCPSGPKNFNASKMRDIFKTQLEQLDVVNSGSRMATSRVMAIPPPPSQLERPHEQKRFSQSLRDLCKRLELNSSNDSQPQLSQKLENLESGMVDLLANLKNARDEADEQYLRQPRVSRLCEKYNLLIESPFRDIPPILHPDLDENTPPSDVEIYRILQKYSSDSKQ